MIKKLKNPFLYPFRGISLITSDLRLFSYSAIPVAISLIVFAIGFYLFFHNYDLFLDYMWSRPRGEGFWQTVLLILWYVLYVAVIPLVVIVGILLFTLVTNLLASPFNDLIAEYVLKRVCNQSVEDLSILRALKDAPRVIKEEAKKLIFFVIVTVALLLLNLVPAVGNLMYLVLQWYFTLNFLTLEFMDYSMEADRLSFRNKWNVVKRLGLQSLAFGFATYILMIVPILNILFIPACVAGATLLYSEVRNNREIAEDESI